MNGEEMKSALMATDEYGDEGYNEGAANWLVSQIEERKMNFEKAMFGRNNFRRMAQLNAEHADFGMSPKFVAAPADVVVAVEAASERMGYVSPADAKSQAIDMVWNAISLAQPKLKNSYDAAVLIVGGMINHNQSDAQLTALAAQLRIDVSILNQAYGLSRLNRI